MLGHVFDLLPFVVLDSYLFYRTLKNIRLFLGVSLLLGILITLDTIDLLTFFYSKGQFLSSFSKQRLNL